MKQILVMMAAVVLVGCSKDTPETSQAAEAEPQVASKPTSEPTPVLPADEKLIADHIVEREIRKKIRKPKGEITEADLKKVTGLNLDSTKITDKGLKEVSKLQKLEFLSLQLTQNTDAGLKEMANLQSLTHLNLRATGITDAGLKDVAKLKKLKWLNLGDCKQITGTGFREVTKLQKLTELKLSLTQITDTDLEEVAKLQKLKYLWLDDTKVTDEGVAKLKKALPNCRTVGP